jgi:hypothetical protein
MFILEGPTVMSAAVSISFCKPEFSDFLYALIAEKDDEAHLTVLSALSRLDLDPWMVAEVLSALPKDVAVGRLATLITQLPCVMDKCRREWNCPSLDWSLAPQI